MGKAETSAEAFAQLAARGQEFLSGVRDNATAPEGVKKMRTFGIEQAAALIGRSTTMIRALEEDPDSDLNRRFGQTPRESNGRRSYSLERINQYRDYFQTRVARPRGSRCARVATGNFKGGCAKTTTAVHFALKCALEGYRTLAIDLDAQGTLTQVLGIMPGVDLGPADTIGPVLIDNPTAIRSVIRPTYVTGMDLIPANLSLQDADLALPNPDVNNAESMGARPHERLHIALSEVEADYDVIVMDLGPNMGAITINALRAATGLVVPIPPAMNDYGSSVLFFSTLADFFTKAGHSLDFQGILVTKHSGSKDAADAEAMIRMAYQPFVFGPKMPVTVELERQSNNFSTIYEARGPLGNAETFRNALKAMDEVNNAILETIQSVWQAQAASATSSELEAA
jgi:chromosome partitioning protein